MRVLFLSTQDKVAWGGSEILWHDAALTMLARGHEVAACYLDWKDATPAPIRNLRQAGVTILPRRPDYPRSLVDKIRLRVPGDPWAVSVRRQLQKIANWRPNLVVVTAGSSSVWPECREIFGERGIAYALVIQAGNDRCWFEDPFRETLGATYRAAREVFYVSQHNRWLINAQLGLPEDFGRVVFNPFSVPFEPRLPWPESAVAPWAFVGRLEPESKGCDLIIEALALPPWRERAVSMSFFGTGPCERGIRELAALRRLENVSFHGHANVLDVWKTHQVLVLPSRYEGMPLAMIEAMLCERVCIVTDVAGNAELMEDGISGFVAESPKISHLAEAMTRAWEARARWKEIGRNAGIAARGKVPALPGAVFSDQLEALK